jgi:hypothetical protein
MMQSNLPRSVVERTAKEFDSFRAEHGSVFKFGRARKKAKCDIESSSPLDGERNKIAHDYFCAKFLY